MTNDKEQRIKRMDRDMNCEVIHDGKLFGNSFMTSCAKGVHALRCVLLLLLMAIGGGVNSAWGQIDYSGTYYIAFAGKSGNNFAPNNQGSNYYLCPTENWCWYEATNNFTNSDNGQPFLTTHKIASGDEEKYKWIVEKHTKNGKDYYSFRYGVDYNEGGSTISRYLMYSLQIRTAAANRIRVHIEKVSYNGTPDDNALFEITTNKNGGYKIRPINIEGYWINVTNGNSDSFQGVSGKNDGPDGHKDVGGTIGIWNEENYEARCYFEDVITRPTITINSDKMIVITAAQSGATIRYTTDGSEPTAENGTTYTVPINPSDGTTIKAVAIVSGEASNVATLQRRLIQNQNNGWTVDESTTDFHFYLTQGDDDNNITKVNTTSLFRPSMEWYIIDNKNCFNYIVNSTNNKYLCYDATKKVYMAAYDNVNDNKYKFSITESPTAGTFNIYSDGQNKLINKANGNASKDIINTLDYSAANANHGNARWKFVLPSDLDKTAPFTVSNPSTGNYTYYKLRSSGDEYYIKAPASADANATMVVAASADDNTYWYLEEAAAATNADWLTYYYIRNAKTGDYLYYANGNPSDNNAAFKASTTNGDADRYQFAWAHSTTADYYFIVPKMLLNQTLNNFSTMNRNSGTLRVQKVRDTGSSAWSFSQVPNSDFKCAQPVITWRAGDGGYVVTPTESDAKIYYKIGEGVLTPTTGTLYTGAISVAELGVESATIRVIAARNSDGSDASTEVSVSVSRVATPEISLTEDGKVEITCATPGASIFYEMDTTSPSNPTSSSTSYTGPIEGAAGKVIKAIAVKGGWINSAVATSETITFGCAKPVIKKTSATTFTIQCVFPTSGVTIRYTKGDGTQADPTASNGTVYSVPVTFSESELPFTIKAIAVADGYTSSEVVTKQLTESLNEDVDGYYEIASAEDFSKFIQMVTSGDADKKYKITTDITLSGNDAIDVPFTGELKSVAKGDGTFPTISGLTHPIFYKIDGGIVKNIILELANDWSNNNSGNGQTNAGAIANVVEGTEVKKASIYNCGVLSGSVSGNNCVGSLVGLLGDTLNNTKCYARVINCYSYATVGGGSNKGGIVGYNSYQSNASDIKTMVMNCMFYGDIKGGTNKSPVYGGKNINNLTDGLNTFNYYRYESPYSKNKEITSGKYNCALALEDKYLNRFEFYRQLLNSNKRLAAIYATGSADDAEEKMAKWVLETADRQNDNPLPFPILKAQGRYPSIINYDAEHAPDSATIGRFMGGRLTENSSNKTLTVNISTSKTDGDGVGGLAWPEGASINTTSTPLTLIRTDKDSVRYNFNYDKIQLPYYNDVGTGNYTENKVVTGWKITGITGGTAGTYTAADTWGGYNFADRRCTNKDKYSVSGRVFSQGAYYDVPYGVTAITIEPYWGKAVYVADANYDVVYNKDDNYTVDNVTELGTQYVNKSDTTINGSTQKVYTSISDAIGQLTNTPVVYDNALVLVGNLHMASVPSNGSKGFTIMSIDLDEDNEPDYSLIYHHDNRKNVSPIRFDFLNVPGTAMAQKPNGSNRIRNVSIFSPTGWFEVTNTCNISMVQFECDNTGYKDSPATKNSAPVIFQGGMIDQFVSTKTSTNLTRTPYIHVGGTAWFNAFGNGTHSDGTGATPHVPVSVTGGDFVGFYLTGTYQPKVDALTDSAECYISGGRFKEVAGASQEQLKGDAHWQIYNADIANFYGGGINATNNITGNIIVDIFNSHVTQYCGGPKFGDMETGKTVTTEATGCTFGKYFGAGYGGISYLRLKYYDESNTTSFASWDDNYVADKGKYFDGTTTNANNSHVDYGKKGPGVATDFDYEIFVWSSGQVGGRFYVKFASFSLATCNDVTSTLTNCIVNQDFYGGGSSGKVAGTATSTLDGCTVHGNVFGAGYKSEVEKVKIRNSGFVEVPKYNPSSGMFEAPTLSGTTEYEWEQVTSMPDNNNWGIEETGGKKYIKTTADFNTLGQVGNSVLSIRGNTQVDGKIVEGVNNGGVFGGGDESATIHNTEVTINTTGERAISNVYGGGNIAPVGGNTIVTLRGNTLISGNVFGGGNKAKVSGTAKVNIEE